MPKPRKKKGKGNDAGEQDGFPGGDPPAPERPPQSFDPYKAAAGLKDWRPAADALNETVSVRTPFPDFNRAVRVGGLPVKRMHTIHGPTHGGKTAFVIGLLRGFIDPGFLAGYIDAERSLAKEFTGQLIGDLHERPNFVAEYPDTYEETIKIVDGFLDHAAKIVKSHPEFRCALVVDSINKLTPKRELEKYLKAGPDEVSKGHHARYRAAVNQAWMDRITPKLERANCAFIAIAQEREEQSTNDFVRDAFKVKGGQSLQYDASIVARVMKASPIFLGTEKQNDKIIGFRHRVRVWKSKVGHMDGRYTDCYFHLSNGKIAPPGFDTARDAIEVGADLGIVKKSSSWYSYKGRRWQGIPRAAKYLRDHPEKLTELLDDIANGLDVIEGRK